MTKLITDNNVIITDPDKVADMQRKFYEKLYSKDRNLPEREHIRDKLYNLNIPSLPDHISESLEGKLYMKELTVALKNTKNNKSPDIDGYPIEFYKFFWKDLGNFVLNALNFSYVTGNLSISLKRGIITCIPKPNKCRFYLKNWRPISLLNAVYKLAASCIANRIKPVLGQINNENQKGFIKGRCIGENIRMIYDALFYAKLQHKPGLLLLIDFEKAFDSISWNFLQEALNKFIVGPFMQKWMYLFYNDIQSCVLQNGFLSPFFPISRGCRQGDPLSSYLFTLAVEILAKMIRNNTKIKGLRIDGLEIKLGQYADDTQIFLDGSEEALDLTLKVLEEFRLLSGLKINMEKTKAVWIGSMINSNLRLCS